MKRIIPLSVIVCLSIIGLAGCAMTRTPSQSNVRIGFQNSPAMALVMVAAEKGFFEKNGVTVDLREFTAGKFALEALLSGSLDMSISGDVPAGLALMQGHTFSVPAQVVAKTTNEVRIVAKKESGLATPEAFFKSGKRKLATSLGGGPEFFTYDFMQKNKLGRQDVEIISLQPSDMPVALKTGNVDAIAIFDPFAFIAERQMEGESLTFTDTSLYSELYVLEVSPTLSRNRDTVKKILRALIDAEDYAQKYPREAQSIVGKYTKLDPETIQGIWQNFDFRVALTPQLEEYWQRQSVWAQETQKVSPTGSLHNPREAIETELLRSIDPARVEIANG